MSCSSKEMWTEERKALLQRSAGANALESVIFLKHTCSDSKVNKLIYAYMKGGWELQCFRCAAYKKGPLIFYYQKRGHGKYGFLQSRFALFVFLIIVMTLNVIHSCT